ncbi:acetylcholinesterase-like [Rhipicephalus sanguineus]|uniref:acetylcholinesterase-like n=1 Tax=Rhipicephalus sanguineus TaxID=34632 RepID=UPI0020C3F601|nr:acetylcholinesterase-like [Rhipicephalus sanguineus]
MFGIGLLLYYVWEVDHEVEVRTLRGRYAGRTLVVGAKHVHEFLGIYFARDPVRSMRFQQSLVMDKQMLLTKALSMKPCCVQDKDYAMEDIDGPVSERCLHLNIWTPMLPGRRCKSDCGLRTVLVVFVGRDFQYGGNSHNLYRGELLALYADAVVVVPNYRLGPFGFLNGRIVDITGNVGLYDQKVALDWVLENIEFFGGNPEDIVPVGHDAGAISIMHHLFETKSHWMQRVKRVVLHTSSFFRPYRDNTRDALQNTLQMGRLCFCHPEEGVDLVVECLQTIPSSRLRMAARHAYTLAPIFVPSNTIETMPSAAIKIHNSSAARPWLRDKEFLLGNVADEGSFEYSMILNRLAELKYVLPEGSFPNVTAEIITFLSELPLGGQVEDIIGEYRKCYRNETYIDADMWKNILGDILVYCPMQYLAETLSALGNKASRSNIDIPYSSSAAAAAAAVLLLQIII